VDDDVDDDVEKDSKGEEDVINSLQEEKESDNVVNRVSSRHTLYRIEGKDEEEKIEDTISSCIRNESKVEAETVFDLPTSPNGGDIPGSVIRW